MKIIKTRKLNYNHTVYACFIGYIVQAIINNFAPLLFITFQSQYGITLDKIALLVTFNFGVQFFVDLGSPMVLKKIGYKSGATIAHVFCALGLIGMAVLPEMLPYPFIGLIISIAIYAIGGGIIEVLLGPIVEACPTDNKEGTMSLLHSFYCWGHVGVVLISTIYFVVFGIENWKYIAIMWSIIPILNTFFFMQVPIISLEESTGEEMSVNSLLKNKIFWNMIMLMFCAAACEQSVSQWASAFVEKGLGVNKAIGDLAGPMTFAFLMGVSRVLYAKVSEKIDLEKFMRVSSILCLISYLMVALSKNPIIGLIGCGLCGFSVGILWPGTFSLAARTIRGGGTAMFAFMALAGDLGCMMGPTFVGYTSELLGKSIQNGILTAVVFPIILIVGLSICKRNLNNSCRDELIDVNLF